MCRSDEKQCWLENLVVTHFRGQVQFKLAEPDQTHSNITTDITHYGQHSPQTTTHAALLAAERSPSDHQRSGPGMGLTARVGVGRWAQARPGPGSTECTRR